MRPQLFRSRRMVFSGNIVGAVALSLHNSFRTLRQSLSSDCLFFNLRRIFILDIKLCRLRGAVSIDFSGKIFSSFSSLLSLLMSKSISNSKFFMLAHAGNSQRLVKRVVGRGTVAKLVEIGGEGVVSSMSSHTSCLSSFPSL